MAKRTGRYATPEARERWEKFRVNGAKAWHLKSMLENVRHLRRLGVLTIVEQVQLEDIIQSKLDLVDAERINLGAKNVERREHRNEP